MGGRVRAMSGRGASNALGVDGGGLIRGSCCSPKSHSVVWWVVGLNMMLWAYTSPAGEMGSALCCQPHWLCIAAGGTSVDK